MNTASKGAAGRWLKPVSLFGAVILCGALAGCADSPNSRFPSLAQINPVGNILSKEEQSQALKDMEQAQKTHGESAEEEIEGR